LINNAGIMPLSFVKILKLTSGTNVDVNQKVYFSVTASAIPHMINQILDIS